MNILHAGIFKDHCLGGDILFKKGFEQNGIAVEAFDYREISKERGSAAMQAALAERASGKDILFVGKGEQLDPKTLADIRRQGVRVALWYGEPPHLPSFPWLKQLLPQIDILFSSTSGPILEQYRQLSETTQVVYYVNPVDPELVTAQAPIAKTYDVVFTGTKHKDMPGVSAALRDQTIDYLRRRQDVAFFGNAHLKGWSRWLTKLGLQEKPRKVRGQDYIDTIRKAKIGVGVNMIQDQPRYTSDRLQHFLAFGTFFLPCYFPELEKLFRLDEEVIPYYDRKDLARKLDYYLVHDREREAIAAAAQQRVLRDYNIQRVTRMMLDIMGRGRSELFAELQQDPAR